MKTFSTKFRFWKNWLSAKNKQTKKTKQEKTSIISQQADLLWRRGAQCTVVMNLISFVDFKAHRDTLQLFTGPLLVDMESLLQMELTDLQCNSERKTKFREAQGRVDMTGQFLRELPPSFPELSDVFCWLMCFLEAHNCVKNLSQL